MEDLLSKFTVGEIALFCVLLAAAIKGIVEFFDWAWGRIRKVTDADYQTKEERKTLRKQADKAEAFMTTEHERLDAQIADLQEADKRVKAEVQRTNAQILDKLTAIESTLNEHIRVDDERNADSTREYILRFNMELVQDIKHTREDFIEVLAKIDEYERYCKTHEDYENNRAVSAIHNIKNVYEERLQKRDFL